MADKNYTGYTVYTVDRIEENIAVLYDDEENESNVDVSLLPENIKESDIIRFNPENGVYTIDTEKTAQVKADLEERFRKLFKTKN